jgi:sulfur-carrier protein adenylyltransferase/sulfurtransferase
MFTTEELTRYSRHIILNEIGEGGQLRIKKSKILVIGCGGLGCPVLQYLTAAGVGTIGIMDGDKVDLSNLQRQILFTADDIGHFKVDAAKEKLTRLNPNIKFNIIPEFITEKNALEIISDYDIIIDGLDNFPTRYLINDACVITGKPLVFGSVLKFEGQVSVFNYSGGPTYRCLFPEPPEETNTCSDSGVIGVLPGIVGALQANEALKIAAGYGEVLSGKLLIFDALSTQFSLFEFSASEENKQPKDLMGHSAPESCKNIEISHGELEAAIEAGEDILLIDIREDYERTPLKYPAIILPLEHVSNAEVWDQYSERKIVIVCNAGNRSKAAANHLLKIGKIKEIFSLKGGAEKISVQY